MSFTEKIHNSLSSSFFKSTCYSPIICENCYFLKNKISDSNQYKSILSNIKNNPFRNFLKQENYHSLSSYNNWFSEIHHFFCEDCLSLFTEDFFKYNTDDEMNNSEFFTSSYEYCDFQSLEDGLKIDILCHITLLNFKKNFLSKLNNDSIYVYTIIPFNFGFPIENIVDRNKTTIKNFNDFLNNEFINHLYFAFEDVPSPSLFYNDDFKHSSIVRFKINECDFKLNLNDSFNPHEDNNNLFSFYTSKHDIQTVDFYDFSKEDWVNTFDYEGMEKLRLNNINFFSNDTVLTYNHFSLNSYLRHLVSSNLNELF